jgi:MraZ protein
MGSSRLFQPGSTYFDAPHAMAFRGNYDNTLDAKNRLTIPARLRKELADGVVVALQRDAPECVAVWRPGDYEAYVDGLLEGIPRLSSDYGNIERFSNAWSVELELDAAGRVMVPAKMLAKAGLGRDVAVIGAGNRLEIWDREAWERISDQIVSTVQQIGPGSSSGHTS